MRIRNLLRLNRLGPAAVLGFVLGLASPGDAQEVAYTGKLHIGFGDQDNTVPFTSPRANNAIPGCAANPLLNPQATFPAGTTAGTLLVNGRANQVGTGAGSPLTFHAVGGVHGGAQERELATCSTVFTPFANPRIRSRTNLASAHWPGRKGAFTSMIASAPIPATPMATYRLSEGGGHDFGGPSVTADIPLIDFANAGEARLAKGPATFGGAVPFSGVTAVQLGINFPGGISSSMPATTFGVDLYGNGFIELPLRFGTDAKGVSILSATTSAVATNYAFGLLAGDHRGTFALRTPGGTTQNMNGAIRTLGGGNTATPMPTVMLPGGTVVDCGAQDPVRCELTSHIAASVVAFEWTTGTVTFTDMIGDFSTVRTAMGFDVAVAPSTAVAGETRRLQLVSPWAASVQLTPGTFGLGAVLPQLGFGGVAVLQIDIIPVPEPSSTGILPLGSLGLLFLRRRVALPAITISVRAT